MLTARPVDFRCEFCCSGPPSGGTAAGATPDGIVVEMRGATVPGNVQLGAHVLQVGRGRFRPYVSASIGRFERVRLESGGESLSGEIADKTVHGWWQLGIRATIDL